MCVDSVLSRSLTLWGVPFGIVKELPFFLYKWMINITIIIFALPGIYGSKG